MNALRISLLFLAFMLAGAFGAHFYKQFGGVCSPRFVSALFLPLWCARTSPELFSNHPRNMSVFACRAVGAFLEIVNPESQQEEAIQALNGDALRLARQVRWSDS